MSDSLRDQLMKAGFAAPSKPEPAPRRPQEQQRQRSSPQRPSGPQRPPRPQQRPQHNRPSTPSAPSRGATDAQPVARDRSDIDLAKAYALRDKTEREAREREQREAERRSRERKERRQKLATALGGKALNDVAAELPRHFPHTNKIRRIYVTPEQLPRLNGGELAVVQLAGRYLLVTRETALSAQAIDADALVLLCDPQADAEDDIPPDLVW